MYEDENRKIENIWAGFLGGLELANRWRCFTEKE